MTAVFTRVGNACVHCGSPAVTSFVPARVADHAAILLCMRCERLTIRTPHGLSPWQAPGRTLATAAVHGLAASEPAFAA